MAFNTEDVDRGDNIWSYADGVLGKGTVNSERARSQPRLHYPGRFLNTPSRSKGIRKVGPPSIEGVHQMMRLLMHAGHRDFG
jgi:hypothetical protein